MTERVIWTAPKFNVGDRVRCRYWPDSQVETVLDAEIEDGLGRYVRTSGGGTYGEGALEKADPNSGEMT